MHNLENICSFTIRVFQMIHRSIDYTISKISFANIMTALIRNIFKYCKVVELRVAETSFPKLIFA
jgi:hypothetical protein